MSLWGPAAEAEIEYRQAQLKKAWGSRPSGRSDRDGHDGRVEQRAERRTEQRAARRARQSRAEQIEEGIAGMRPAPAARHGLFA